MEIEKDKICHKPSTKEFITSLGSMMYEDLVALDEDEAHLFNGAGLRASVSLYMLVFSLNRSSATSMFATSITSLTKASSRRSLLANYRRATPAK
jgi:hypothetical protein